MMLLDWSRYLPDDILVKVDRAAMARGPRDARARCSTTASSSSRGACRFDSSSGTAASKWLLRELLDRYVPRALVERPKMGFGVPIELAARSAARVGRDLLDERRLAARGLPRPEPIRRLWQAHLSSAGQRGGTRCGTCSMLQKPGTTTTRLP